MRWSTLIPRQIRPLAKSLLRQIQSWIWWVKRRVVPLRPWEGNHHPTLLTIEPWKGMATGEYAIDFLGVKTDPKFRAHFKPSKNGFVQSRYPVPDQSYFEYIFLLESIKNAPGPFYTIFELGAGYGYWLVSAAQAVKVRQHLVPCLVGVEMEATRFRWMQEHFRNNGLDPNSHELLQAAVSNYSGIASYMPEGGDGEDYGLSVALNRSSKNTVQVPCIRLGPMLEKHARVDLLHMDIQGEELVVLEDARLEITKGVSHLVVGTHSSSLHSSILALLVEEGWTVCFEYSGKSYHQTDFGEILFVDGIIAAENPRLRSEPMGEDDRISTQTVPKVERS